MLVSVCSIICVILLIRLVVLVDSLCSLSCVVLVVVSVDVTAVWTALSNVGRGCCGSPSAFGALSFINLVCSWLPDRHNYSSRGQDLSVLWCLGIVLWNGI